MSGDGWPIGGQRCLVLAGSSGDERRQAHPDDDPAWYEPLHIRAPAASRKTLSDKLSAGADVLIAPAWLTHPWAASRVGEGRSSREWTMAAVRIAQEATEGFDAPTLVAGPVPRLAGLDDGTTGRRPTLEASLADALRQICGTLADGGVDMLCVEDQGSLDAWRESLKAAVETGLPVWAELPDMGEDPGPWLEIAAGVGTVPLLAALRTGDETALARAASLLDGQDRSVAGVSISTIDSASPASPASDEWFESSARQLALAGARMVALFDGAVPDRVARLRAGVDAAEKERRKAAETADASWTAAIAVGAEQAPGGRALWVGPRPASALPDRFAWTTVELSELAILPSAGFRFVVAPRWHPGLEGLLDDGGLLVTRGPDALRPGRLTVVDVTDDPGGAIVLARRG